MRLAFAALALSLSAVPALAQDLQFELINESSITLANLFVSPVSVDEWGNDIMAGTVLAPGESGLITVPGGMSVCEFDMRFVADNGNEVTGSADLCAMTSFTLSD
ncbi:MAG: hypothetical protein CFE34_05170 [Rhodobacteraceae bacterium PARR1]|nr:MAG: hypothetical protein CFE34_05170 [Rhodobacteraceae bacterium PARR1]